MKQAHFGGFLVLAAFAAILAVGPAFAASVQDAPAATAEGKVTAYEAGKSITLGEGDAKKEFKIDDKTMVKDKIAVGETVKVWATDGVATKITHAEHKK
jgi:opacity protein-like surface antigen